MPARSGGAPGRSPPAQADPRPAVPPGDVTDTSHRLVLPGDVVPLCVDGAVTDRLLSRVDSALRGLVEPSADNQQSMRPSRMTAEFGGTLRVALAGQDDAA